MVREEKGSWMVLLLAFVVLFFSAFFVCLFVLLLCKGLLLAVFDSVRLLVGKRGVAGVVAGVVAVRINGECVVLGNG